MSSNRTHRNTSSEAGSEEGYVDYRVCSISLLPSIPFLNQASLTTSVLNEASIKNTSVIVAYHPTIFKPLQSFTLSNSLQASLLKCAASGISVYSPHSALDSVWGGVNDWLSEGLIKGKEDGEVRALVREKVNTTTGISEGAEGRLVTLKEPISMDVLEKRIKSHLKLAQSLFSIIQYLCVLISALPMCFLLL